MGYTAIFQGLKPVGDASFICQPRSSVQHSAGASDGRSRRRYPGVDGQSPVCVDQSAAPSTPGRIFIERSA